MALDGLLTQYPEWFGVRAVATVVALAAWLVLVGVLRGLTAKRPVQPGPRTGELIDDVPPAVVTLLTNDWTLTGAPSSCRWSQMGR